MISHTSHNGCTLDAKWSNAMKESGLRIRVESELKDSFLHACKKDDLPAAQVIRGFMRSYVEHRSRGEQIDLFLSTQITKQLLLGDNK
jgi:hypothetical protein